MKEVSISDLQSYLSKFGKRGSETVNILAASTKFLEATRSPLGMELLKDDIDRHDVLLAKLYEERATPEELAEFRYLKHRIRKVCERISAHIEATNKILSTHN